MLLDTLLKLLFEQEHLEHSRYLNDGFIVHDVENITFVKNKTKYFRLRRSDEIGTERPETDLRLY